MSNLPCFSKNSIRFYISFASKNALRLIFLDMSKFFRAKHFTFINVFMLKAYYIFKPAIMYKNFKAP